MMPRDLDQTFFHNGIIAFYLIALLMWISLKFFHVVPHGKLNSSGWGPTIPASWAWFLFESPTLWLTLWLFPFGRHFSNPKSFVLMSPYLFHYFHRTIIYPLRLSRSQAKNFPLSMALMCLGINLLNVYIQARWVSHYKDDYDNDKFFWLRFVVGMLVFIPGMCVNVWADNVLVGLKKQGGGYKVPRGGLFDLVSCPNYFGEMMEWLGWAVMTWSWAGFGFFVFTCSNLVPRARATRQWYWEKFKDDYPKDIKAVIPFLY